MLAKTKSSKNIHLNRDFSKILPKYRLFKIFDPIRVVFLQILTKIEIFENFDQNRHFV